MAIEITGSGHNPGTIISESQRQQGVQSATQAQPAPVAATPVQEGDTVNLTSTASQLRALEQQLSTQPVIDTQRVAAIRNDIQTGQYQINPARVADKMIQLESLINQRLG
ncbi:MAG: flagellar biosynthesis anti-sigma factor FlgM [Gammaproteobacteria bacterium]|nr:flagellar biosynthesis anti-sigma factor FlgM [Gammaproteobacteria bacterium]